MTKYNIYEEYQEVKCLLEDVKEGCLINNTDIDHDPTKLAEFDNLEEAQAMFSTLKSKCENLGTRCQRIIEYELVKTIYNEDGDVEDWQQIAISTF